MTEPDAGVGAVEVEGSGGPWPSRLLWVVAAAVVSIAAWDLNDAMARPGGLGGGIGEAFPLLIPLGLAWWGKRSDNLGFGILALAVVVVEVAVIRMALVFS